MPVNVETNIAIRDRVRSDLLLPRPVDRAGPTITDDLTDEQLANLEKLRLFNDRFLRSVRGGNPAAIEDTRPRLPAGAPRGTGRRQTFAGSNHAIGLDLLISWGPLAFPYIVTEIQLTGENINVAPAAGVIRAALFVTATDRTNEVAAPTEPQIWPQEQPELGSDRVLVVAGPSSNSIRYAAGVLVLDQGQFLTARLRVSTGGMNATIGVTIEEVGALGAATYADLLPIGRVTLNPSTRPVAPRSTTPAVPRGAILRVTQGGRILAERTVPWIALDDSIRARWFTEQLTGTPSPGVEWLR